MTAHDPFRAQTAGEPPATTTEKAAPGAVAAPAAEGGEPGPKASQGAPAAQDGPLVAPEAADAVVEWVHSGAGGTVIDRARAALAAEADRTPSRRRRSVLEALEGVLGRVEVVAALDDGAQ